MNILERIDEALALAQNHRFVGTEARFNRITKILTEIRDEIESQDDKNNSQK